MREFTADRMVSRRGDCTVGGLAQQRCCGPSTEAVMPAHATPKNDGRVPQWLGPGPSLSRMMTLDE